MMMASMRDLALNNLPGTGLLPSHELQSLLGDCILDQLKCSDGTWGN
jgi:hypothetical protein